MELSQAERASVAQKEELPPRRVRAVCAVISYSRYVWQPTSLGLARVSACLCVAPGRAVLSCPASTHTALVSGDMHPH